VRSAGQKLGLKHFKPIKPLGCGDTGSVHLVELRGTDQVYAMKAMDKTVMLDRNKVHRACAERQILDRLDHPFLPTLYASFQVRTTPLITPHVAVLIISSRWQKVLCAMRLSVVVDLTCLQTATHVCLITDFCPGGELFLVLESQPKKHFREESARYGYIAFAFLQYCVGGGFECKSVYPSFDDRFYAAEVVLALEYLHCKGK
jgi:serine/threonine protein kinase